MEHFEYHNDKHWLLLFSFHLPFLLHIVLLGILVGSSGAEFLLAKIRRTNGLFYSISNILLLCFKKYIQLIHFLDVVVSLSSLAVAIIFVL